MKPRFATYRPTLYSCHATLASSILRYLVAIYGKI